MNVGNYDDSQTEVTTSFTPILLPEPFSTAHVLELLHVSLRDCMDLAVDQVLLSWFIKPDVSNVQQTEIDSTIWWGRRDSLRIRGGSCSVDVGYS